MFTIPSQAAKSRSRSRQWEVVDNLLVEDRLCLLILQLIFLLVDWLHPVLRNLRRFGQQVGRRYPNSK
jgi:hypothetical protein